MQETPRQYTTRLLGYIRGKDPLTTLSRTPGHLARLLRGASPVTLRRKPGRGRWSAVEILAHMAEAELVVGYRMRLVSGRNRVRIQPYDQDRWQRHSGYLHRDPRRALGMLRSLREANLALLRSLPTRSWKQYGIHEERGRETMTRIVDLLAGHDINHLMQLEKLLRGKERKR